MDKKLIKSQNKVIAGVCGGIGEYFEIDSTIVRIIWALFSLFYGSGLILYLVAALVMPDAEHPADMDTVEVKVTDSDTFEETIDNSETINVEIVE